MAILKFNQAYFKIYSNLFSSNMIGFDERVIFNIFTILQSIIIGKYTQDFIQTSECIVNKNIRQKCRAYLHKSQRVFTNNEILVPRNSPLT